MHSGVLERKAQVGCGSVQYHEGQVCIAPLYLLRRQLRTCMTRIRLFVPTTWPKKKASLKVPAFSSDGGLLSVGLALTWQAKEWARTERTRLSLA